MNNFGIIENENKFNFNCKMLSLARKYRNFTQKMLSDRTNISQAHLSKIEQGLQIPSNEYLTSISKALDFPINFFLQTGNFFPPITPFHRKRSGLSTKIQEHAEALANLKRINLQILRSEVNIEGRVPKLDLDEYEGKPALVAQAIRNYFKLPRGPIENLVEVLEDFGVFIFLEGMGSNQLDGFTLLGDGAYPLIFINEAFSGDRQRLTEGHELGHYVMHEIVTPTAEQEAWEFATEFLMPKEDIQFDLRQARKLSDFADLKRKWKISMAALIRRSRDLNIIGEQRYRYLMQCMAPYRVVEPVNIPKEKPTLFNELIDTYINDLHYTEEDLEKILCINESLYDELYKQKDIRLRILKII